MSSKPHLVGLTGGIGAGKSTVTAALGKMKIPVFDCDAVVHELYSDPDTLRQLHMLFSITQQGDEARHAISQLAVTDPASVLPVLDDIFRPGIARKLKEFQGKHRRVQLVVLDAPLLFESHMDRQCDFSIVISCPEEIRRLRVMQRPNMTEGKLDMILKNQLTETDRRLRGNYVIDNTGTLESLQQNVLKTMLDIAGYYRNGDMI